jgi:hypothetical protein
MESQHEQHGLPDELREVADVLRDERPTLDPLALDRVKLRAMSAARRVTSTRDRGSFMKSRLTTLIAAAFLALSTGGAFALAGGGGAGGKDGGSASFSQYRCEHSKGHASGCEEGKEEKEKGQGNGEGGGKDKHEGGDKGEGRGKGHGKD